MSGVISLEEQMEEVRDRIAELEALPTLSADEKDELDGLRAFDVSSRSTVDGARVSVEGGVSEAENASIAAVYEAADPEQHDAARVASTEAEADRILTELVEGEESDGTEGLKVLGQAPSDGTGDFVFGLTGQHGKGTDERFSHVHRDWVREGTMSFADGIDVLRGQQQTIEDHKWALKDVEPVVCEREGEYVLGFKAPNGREYVPTEKALNDLVGSIGRASTWAVSDLMTPKEHATKKEKATGEKVILYTRDHLDMEAVVHYLKATVFRAGEGRIDQKKERLWRTWQDGTLRAVLSTQYAIVNNVWFLTVLSEIIPGGLLSHWRGDADSIFGNVLIPDSLRKEADSEYGGMVSISNSEIGIRRIGSTPSVFRSICMNGCIWGGEKGKGVNKRHRGDIDLDGLKETIRKNLDAQIPLLGQGIDQMLALRSLTIPKELSVREFTAALAGQLKLSKVEAAGVLTAYGTEKEILGEKEARSVFGLLNAVTRYGQTLSNEGWVKFDMLGGEMLGWDAGTLAKVAAVAKSLSEKDVDNAYAA